MRQGKRLGALVWLLLIVLSLGSAWADVCQGSKIPKADLAQYDVQAILSPADQEAALQTHLPDGQPTCPRLLPQHEYILCYDPGNRVALWAAYELRAEDVVKADRLDAFRTDPRLSEDENSGAVAINMAWAARSTTSRLRSSTSRNSSLNNLGTTAPTETSPGPARTTERRPLMAR